MRHTIEEEKQKREELAVKDAILKQDVERLKCLATCNGNMANENEEKRLQSHQTDLDKAEEQSHLVCQVEVNAMKMEALHADLDEANGHLVEV